MTCESLDAPEFKTPLFHTSVAFRMTEYYDPRWLWHAGRQTHSYPAVSPVPLIVLLWEHNALVTCCALTLLVGQQEGHLVLKN